MAPALLGDPDGLVSAIAACVIGGVDLMGGRGRLWAAVIGTVFLAALRNALNLQGIQPFMQSLVIGCLIVTGQLVAGCDGPIPTRISLRST